MNVLFAFLAGLVLGIGLIVSGMSDPAKVIAFLDLAGKWDPSLALVMGGLLPWGWARSRSPNVAKRHGWDCPCCCPQRATLIAV